MNVARATVVLLVLLTASPSGMAAQAREHDTVLSVDGDVLGAALSYARARGPGRYLGLGVGIGGSLWSRVLLAGRHFAHEGGPSYEARDGATDKELLELLHAEVFRRWIPSEQWHLDAGVRAAVMIHFDSSDDDPGIPLFLGVYGSAMWGTQRLKLGPRLLVGMFTEGSSAREFGVYLVPLSGRVSFGR